MLCALSLSLSLSLSLPPSPCAAPTRVVLLQAADRFCVFVHYVHVVFDDEHVLNLMCVYIYDLVPKGVHENRTKGVEIKLIIH